MSDRRSQFGHLQPFAFVFQQTFKGLLHLDTGRWLCQFQIKSFVYFFVENDKMFVGTVIFQRTHAITDPAQTP